MATKNLQLLQTLVETDMTLTQSEMPADAKTVGESIDGLLLDMEIISTNISNMEQHVDNMQGDMDAMGKKVSETMTAEEINIAIDSKFADGVGKVTTGNGSVLDDNGLVVSNPNQEIKTQIT